MREEKVMTFTKLFPKEAYQKYKVIYADPPWHYNDFRDCPSMGGGVEGHYNSMKTEDICNLPIKDLADENCLLFLWVTFPCLKDGFKVMESWGFKYSSIGFNWVKLNSDGTPFFGIGYYTKSNSELCLIGLKGKASELVVSDKVSSVILSKRREHSRKPDEARKRIIELCGDIPRIELFARERFEGWDVWGNEIPTSTQHILKINEVLK
jgi:N6-adenosine-specific RNA methylase IME4